MDPIEAQSYQAWWDSKIPDNRFVVAPRGGIPRNIGAAQRSFPQVVEDAVIEEFKISHPEIITIESWELTSLSKPHKIANLDHTIGKNQVRNQAEFYDHATETHYDVSINYDLVLRQTLIFG